MRRSSEISNGPASTTSTTASHSPTGSHSHYGDLDEPLGLVRIIADRQPDEVYHLAAQSHVQVSFDIPDYTGSVTGLGTIRLLEAIRISGAPRSLLPGVLVGDVRLAPPPQSEQTPFHPRSPYAVAKVYAYWATVNYREAYGMFATNGILFNHESPRRRELRHPQDHPDRVRAPPRQQPGQRSSKLTRGNPGHTGASNQTRAVNTGWRAWRRRSRTWCWERRIRYMVDTDARYWPSSSRVAQIWAGAWSRNRSEFATARISSTCVVAERPMGSWAWSWRPGRSWRSVLPVGVARERPTDRQALARETPGLRVRRRRCR